ncbi:MAG: heme-binding protein [Bacteriovoracia bacterium]
MTSTILSLFNWKGEAFERFTVLCSQGPFELRLYHRMLCGRVRTGGSQEDALKKGTTYLKDYINGNNFRVSKITNNGNFFYTKHGNLWETGVLLPPDMTLFNAPKPINRLVKIDELPPARVAVLKSVGKYSLSLFERKASELEKWIHYKGYDRKDSFRVLLTGPSLFKTKFEVHYEVT